MNEQTSKNVRSKHRQMYYSIKFRYNKLKEIAEVFGHKFKIVIWRSPRPISIKPQKVLALKAFLFLYIKFMS